MVIKKNPKSTRKTVVIKTVQEAVLYFSSDDPGVAVSDVVYTESEGVPCFVNSRTGEIVDLGGEYYL